MNIKKLLKKHSVLYYSIFFSIIILVTYLLFALYVSVTLNGIIKKAFNNEPYNNNLRNIISEYDYSILNPRQPECEEKLKVKTECSNTFPFILPFLTDAYFMYSYTVTDTSTGEVVYDSPNSHVILKLDYTSFPTHIVDIENAP